MTDRWAGRGSITDQVGTTGRVCGGGEGGGGYFVKLHNLNQLFVDGNDYCLIG